MTVETFAILIPLLPIAAAVLIGVVGLTVLKSRSHWLAILGVAAALCCAIPLYDSAESTPHIPPPPGETVHIGTVARLHHEIPIYSWFSTGQSGAKGFNVEFLIDPLTVVMLLTVLSVSLLVIIYSVGYMRDHHGHPERGYERFFAYLCLFVFSMCCLVLGGNFLMLYLGWELVGLCSYLLIGFYYGKPAAAAAAKKAFIVNRVGDFGFGLGILLIYLNFGRLDYGYVFSHVSQLSTETATVIALLLFCGACGKSAQLPLHVWLPDAMEGPSPVSALIHAATMVTAGIYMVARCHTIFEASPLAMNVVATVGCMTALFAATIALAQYDMKRILAYSTISQLGFMFLGLGVGAMTSAVFHLFTHAFFKALLFLGAGSVMHAMHGEIDIRRFGGLRRGLPVTYLTMLIGCLALAGFPGLAGFWSKDEIVHAALAEKPLLGYLALLTAALTAFYTFRMFFWAFHGKEKLPHGVEHAHESGGWMLLPLIVLSIGAAGAGYFGFPLGHSRFASFLSYAVPSLHHAEGALTVMITSGCIAVAGILLASFIYPNRREIAAATAASARPVYDLFHQKWRVDEFYGGLIVQPLRQLGDFCFALDRYFIDGLLWLIAAVPRVIGFTLSGARRGPMQGYALGMSVGLLMLVLWMLFAGIT